MADYYSILGVQRSADQNDIRRAFRTLARKYHPDLNPDDANSEAKFKEVNEAYEVLSNPDSRKKFDTYGDEWKRADEIAARRRASRGAYSTRGGTWDSRDLFSNISDLEDLLGDVGGFGRDAAGVGVVRRAMDIEVSLADAYSGTTITATLTGSGAQRRFEVNIPPGVDNGSAVRVSPERGTEMLFRVSVTPDRRFRRDGADLYTDADVPFEVAILGGEAQVETIDGRMIWVKIPEYSRNGQNIRLRGQGMPKLDASGAKGDLYVTVRPVMPESLTDDQRDLIARYSKSRSETG